MENKSVTAVEWLQSEWQKKDMDTSIRELWKQAKAMEKHQIMQSYNDGKDAIINIEQNKSHETYYNETYNNGKKD